MAAQNYTVALDLPTRQIVITADEGESVKYPYPHRTISEMDAQAAVKRFHTKRLAKNVQFFAMFSEHRLGRQQATELASDYIERDMPLGNITINA